MFLQPTMFNFITNYLNLKDEIALISCQRAMYRFFSPKRTLSSLLQYVVTGNQSKVIQILEKKPELVVLPGRVKDNSKRIFLKASAGELVTWNGDLALAYAILNVLQLFPDRNKAEDIRRAWVLQDDAYERNHGLEYILHGERMPPSLGFSLTPLLDELQDYVNEFDKRNWLQRAEHWSSKIGAEQYLLPAIYIHYYCMAVPFCLPPPFENVSSTRISEIYNYATGQTQNVWAKDVNDAILGQSFGIFRGAKDRAVGVAVGDAGIRCKAGDSVNADLNALRTCEIKTKLGLIAFKKKLRVPLNQQPAIQPHSLDLMPML